MQIQLKQFEIVQALRGYITKQGIDLTGKTVNIEFTAGRKESGLSADISIEGEEIPDLGGDAGEPATAPALSVVKNILSAIATPATEAAAAEPVAVADTAADLPVEKPATSSLFN